MLLKSTSFIVAMFALVVLLFAPFAAKADTYNRVCTASRFRLDGVNATSISVNAYKTYTTSTGVTQCWGTMNVMSNTLYANPALLSETYFTVSIGGLSYKHAEVTSKTFNYTDFATKVVSPAHLVITLTQFGPFGQAGFQIISDKDGSILTQTAPAGIYSEVPFLHGGVSIQ